jgi:chromosome segregation ATPase
MKSVCNYRILSLVLLFLAIGFMYPNHAVSAEKKDKSARRAALMMQKMKQDMEVEKANMQAQFDAQKKDLENKVKSKDEELAKLTKSLVAAESKNKKLENEVKKVNAEKVALETKLQETQEQLSISQKNLADIKTLYSQAQADLKFNDNQRKTLSANLAQTTKSVNECEEKNNKLHQFGTELIQIYDKPGVYEATMREEKFFQLKRVELENILQSKRDNLDDAKFINKKSSY